MKDNPAGPLQANINNHSYIVAGLTTGNYFERWGKIFRTNLAKTCWELTENRRKKPNTNMIPCLYSLLGVGSDIGVAVVVTLLPFLSANNIQSFSLDHGPLVHFSAKLLRLWCRYLNLIAIVFIRGFLVQTGTLNLWLSVCLSVVRQEFLKLGLNY